MFIISPTAAAGKLFRKGEGQPMIAMFASGKKIGMLSDLDRLYPELRQRGVRIELRDDNGNTVGTVKIDRKLDPNEPLVPWEPGITREELDRRTAEPGLTFEEVMKRLGWS